MQPHRCTVILHRPPQEAQGSFIGLGEGCSHIGALLYCIAHLKKLKDHSLDWARDAATSMHCYTASPPLMKLKDHSLDWARDAATSMHCYTASPTSRSSRIIHWIGRGMQPHRCTVILHRPPHEAQGSFIGLGEGCSHIGALLYCIAPLMKLKDHSLDWARDAATSVHCYTASPPS